MALRVISSIAVLLWLLAAAVAPLPAVAQEWQAQLTEQMLRDYDCEVAFFSQVGERMVNGDQVVLAKVHCIDKRAFESFELHPCENPNNRVC